MEEITVIDRTGSYSKSFFSSFFSWHWELFSLDYMRLRTVNRNEAGKIEIDKLPEHEELSLAEEKLGAENWESFISFSLG